MKKIIILFTLFGLLSCSENSENKNTNPELKAKLIGSNLIDKQNNKSAINRGK